MKRGLKDRRNNASYFWMRVSMKRGLKVERNGPGLSTRPCVLSRWKEDWKWEEKGAELSRGGAQSRWKEDWKGILSWLHNLLPNFVSMKRGLKVAFMNLPWETWILRLDEKRIESEERLWKLPKVIWSLDEKRIESRICLLLSLPCLEPVSMKRGLKAIGSHSPPYSESIGLDEKRIESWIAPIRVEVHIWSRWKEDWK